MINIIYEDNHLLVVNKPFNIPMQKDASNDLDLLTIYKQYIKKKYNKPNNVYLGLVHRLDRPTGGLCVFAKTSKAAQRLSNQIRQNKMHKQYNAIVVNNNLLSSDCYIDYLLKDEINNIVTVNPKGKYSELNYSIIDSNSDYALVKINLITGRSHQIRVQFASRNHPLYGDQKYNNKSKVGQQLALYATSLSFEHPTTKEVLTFSVDAPFNLITTKKLV